tara:strand:- start:940 stop:1236 length:297 start_codon:yes stop_codon:yes gene_type:complete
MKKYVNGKLVDMSSDEIKARQEEEKKEQALEPEKKLSALRLERDFLLGQSDWVVIKEREEGGSVSNFADWKEYRQKLRDITKTYKSLQDVKWPTAPSE